jgi:hypothetical protein
MLNKVTPMIDLHVAADSSVSSFFCLLMGYFVSSSLSEESFAFFTHLETVGWFFFQTADFLGLNKLLI